MTDDQEVEELDYDINDIIISTLSGVENEKQMLFGTVSTNLVDAAMTDIYANSIPLSTTPLITSINDYSTTITQEIYQQLKGDASDIAARKRWW
ncbi:unnamed protein product, partial [Rotaria sp. Silwood1]